MKSRFLLSAARVIPGRWQKICSLRPTATPCLTLTKKISLCLFLQANDNFDLWGILFVRKMTVGPGWVQEWMQQQQHQNACSSGSGKFLSRHSRRRQSKVIHCEEDKRTRNKKDGDNEIFIVALWRLYALFHRSAQAQDWSIRSSLNSHVWWL